PPSSSPSPGGPPQAPPRLPRRRNGRGQPPLGAPGRCWGEEVARSAMTIAATLPTYGGAIRMTAARPATLPRRPPHTPTPRHAAPRPPRGPRGAGRGGGGAPGAPGGGGGVGVCGGGKTPPRPPPPRPAGPPRRAGAARTPAQQLHRRGHQRMADLAHVAVR